MQIIPLTAQASQSLSVVLADQDCNINLYQKSTGLFIDLTVNGTVVFAGVICRDRTKIVRQPYLGFIGDLSFMDTQGNSEPNYSGLGERWQLMYLEAGIDV